MLERTGGAQASASGQGWVEEHGWRVPTRLTRSCDKISWPGLARVVVS